MRYFIRFSYVGTEYHGSQVQPNGVTVQEVMERAMTTLLRKPVSLTFAGRTDAGVHAREMWAHWDWNIPEGGTPFSLPKLTARLNNFLPSSIAVQQIVPVRPEAHARYDARDVVAEDAAHGLAHGYCFDGGLAHDASVWRRFGFPAYLCAAWNPRPRDFRHRVSASRIVRDGQGRFPTSSRP